MWVSRILPLLCMTGAVLWVLLSGRSFTMEDILNYTPSQPLLAVLFLWLAFALKSLSLVFPVLLLFAVTGQLFSLPVALAVNTVGIAITLTLPYLLGRAAEPKEIIDMVLYLASDKAAFITGTNFLLDGGRLLAWDRTF